MGNFVKHAWNSEKTLARQPSLLFLETAWGSKGSVNREKGNANPVCLGIDFRVKKIMM